MLITALCSLQTALLAAGPIGATLHVPADYSTIQACIDAAVSGVDECVVAPGTYNETIILGKAITLRSSGGAEVTTIDALGLDRSAVTCATGEGPDTVLDGFTITRGTGRNVGGVSFGGGMFNYFSSPTVLNCAFIQNSSRYGGGMFNQNNSPKVLHCSFSDNRADYGAAIYNYSFDYSDVEPFLVSDCTFSGNIAYSLGGAMFNWLVSPTIYGCTFLENTAERGGGIYNTMASPKVSNCTFHRNTASHGGGIYNEVSRSQTITMCAFIENTASGAGGAIGNSVIDGLTVSNCLFKFNTAANGGGIANGGNVPVTNSTFIGNNATNAGGGMYYGSASNCTFSRNAASSGGGMYGGGSTVTHCSFSGNIATHAGGGMYISFSRTLGNCILWGNSPDEIENSESVPTIRFSDVQGGLPVGTVDGGGNIDLDPMFVRPPNPGPDGTWDGVDDDYGDLRLQPGSPCIDTGDPAFAAQPGETDLEGHARVLCGRVDMGAFEFGIGDYDCNQAINLLDFSLWNGCMTGPSFEGDSSSLDQSTRRKPGDKVVRGLAPRGSDQRSVVVQSTIENRKSAIPCEAFDFDADGDVDFFDFAGFQTEFGEPVDTTNLAVFDDPDSDFATYNVRDVDDEFVRFDTSTNSIIWAATGTAYQAGTWTVNGPFLAGGSFKVRFGTKDGERRAYFTETANGFICQIEVSGPNLFISPTIVPVPQE